jgi:hypothetical protein
MSYHSSSMCRQGSHENGEYGEHVQKQIFNITGYDAHNLIYVFVLFAFSNIYLLNLFRHYSIFLCHC